MSHSDHKWIDRVKGFWRAMTSAPELGVLPAATGAYLRNLRDAQTNVLKLNDQQIRIAELISALRDEQARADFLERDNEDLLRHLRSGRLIQPIALASAYEALASDMPELHEVRIDLRPMRIGVMRHAMMVKGGCRALAADIAQKTANLWHGEIYHKLCDTFEIPKEDR